MPDTPAPLTRPPRRTSPPYGTVFRESARLTALGRRAVRNERSEPRVVPAALVATVRQW